MLSFYVPKRGGKSLGDRVLQVLAANSSLLEFLSPCTATGCRFLPVSLLRVCESLLFPPCRYQDVYSQSYIMVMASGRWLGVHVDLLTSLLIGTVAVAAVLVSQDAGRYKIP